MSQQRHLSQEADAEYASLRYDAAMQQRVIALAVRLQHEHRETLTAAQIEAAAEEVGLEPEFVRQAIRELSTEPESARDAKTRKRQSRQPKPVVAESERDVSWVWTLVGGFVYFFVKGWWKAGLVAMALYFFTGGLSWLMLPFFAQRFVEAVEAWEANMGGDPARTTAALQHLADLHDKGLISEPEYQAKRRELLNRL